MYMKSKKKKTYLIKNSVFSNIKTKKKTQKKKNIDKIASMIITSQYKNDKKKREIQRLISSLNANEIKKVFLKLKIKN